VDSGWVITVQINEEGRSKKDWPSLFLRVADWRKLRVCYDHCMDGEHAHLRALVNPRCIEVVDRRCAEIFSKMSPARRLEVAFGLGAMARQIIAASVRHFHPEFTDDQVAMEVARRVRGGSRT